MINQKKSVTQLCFFEIHHNISDCIISIKLISEKCMEGGLLNEKGQKAEIADHRYRTVGKQARSVDFSIFPAFSAFLCNNSACRKDRTFERIFRFCRHTHPDRFICRCIFITQQHMCDTSCCILQEKRLHNVIVTSCAAASDADLPHIHPAHIFKRIRSVYQCFHRYRCHSALR